jgi:FkbH-like protein
MTVDALRKIRDAPGYSAAVYGFDWANFELWRRERPTPDGVASRVDRSDVERTLLLHWQEHCIECAPPECYAVCPLYVARADRKCARFVYGIVPNAGYSGLFDAGADVRFRRWAKLEAEIAGPVVSPATHRRLASVDRSATAAMGRLSAVLSPLDPRRRVSGALAVFRDAALRRVPGARSCAFDEFVLECHLLEREPFRLVLEWSPRGETTLRHVFEITPGHNLHRLPAHTFGRLDTAAGGRILLYPENDAEPRVVFTWLDFVRYASRPAQAAAGPVAAAGGFVKCVAWDLDNTLWEGVLIEDGADACTLRPGVRELIRALDERGILQTVVSKNDYDEAWAVLERHGLGQYFLYPEIGWGPKSAALRRVAHRLDIGLDSIAFVDDSPFERAEVANALPSVRVYDEASLAGLLELPEFDVPVSETSRGRRGQYRLREQRELAEHEYGGDYLEFLRDCGIQLRIFEPGEPGHVDRCLELVQRSNQLNLSKRAYSREQFEQLVATPGILALALEAEDRFGAYGIIGFVAVDERPEVPLVRDLVVSCRIARKRVEHAFFAWLAGRETGRGAEALRAELVRTPRNGPLQAVFDELPFATASDDGVRLVYELPLPARLPDQVVSVSDLVAA